MTLPVFNRTPVSVARASRNEAGRFRGLLGLRVLLAAALLLAVTAIAIATTGNEVEAAAGNATGTPVISGTAQAGATLTVDVSSINDPDGITNASYHYVWVATDANGNNSAPIAEAMGSPAYVPSNSHVGRKLKVVVGFTDDNGNAEYRASGLTAAVAAAPSDWPVFTAPAAATDITVDENETSVVRFQATDQNQGTVTYSIPSGVAGGLHGNLFSIDSTTGWLSYKTAPDFEDPDNAPANHTHRVIVKASASAKTTTRYVSVMLRDKNEFAPAFSTGTSFNAAENQTAVARVAATDADALDSVKSYAIAGGADQSKFAITNAGVLTFQAAPDFENPTDDGADNNYVVTVRATGDIVDKGKAKSTFYSERNAETGSRVRTTEQTITVTVTDVAEDQNRTSVWSAMLTADVIQHAGGSFVGCSDDIEGHDQCSSPTTLTDDDFTHGDTTYNISRMYIVGNQVFIGSTKAWPSAMRTHGKLNIGTRTLSFSDAHFVSSHNTVASWQNPGVTWSDGDKVPMSLTMPSAPDTTPPAFRSATVIGSMLKVAFDEDFSDDLSLMENLANSAFTVKVNGNAANLSDSPSIGIRNDTDTVILTLRSPVSPSDTLKVSYQKPTTGSNNRLKDAAGNETATFGEQTVVNDTPTGIASNLGQSAVAMTARKYYANTFTTGGAATERFELQNIVLDIDAIGAAHPRVKIYTSNAEGHPHTQVGSFLMPTGTLRAGNNSYSAGNITLNGATTYVLWVDTQVDGTNVLAGTAADAEDAATAGKWAIGDAATWSTGAGWTADQNARALRFSVLALDATAPAYNAATAKGNTLKITFNEELAAAENLANSAFRVRLDGITASLTGSPSIGTGNDADKVTLTLQDPVSASDEVTVSYQKPTTGSNNKLKDVMGNETAAFDRQNVINDTGRNTIWSARLTADRYFMYVGCDNAEEDQDSCSLPSALTNDTFDYHVPAVGNRPHEIKFVLFEEKAVDRLWFSLKSGTPWPNEIRQRGRLNVGTQTFLFADANYTTPKNAYWDNPGFEWTHNQRVELAVTMPVPDTTPPAYNSATVNGNTLEVAFSEELAAAANLANSAFTVKVNGNAASLTGSPSTGTGKNADRVTLTLQSPVSATNTVTVGYQKPTTGNGNKLKDAVGNETASFTDHAVINDTGRDAIWSARLTVNRHLMYFGCDSRDSSQDSCSQPSVLTDDDYNFRIPFLGVQSHQISQVGFHDEAVDRLVLILDGASWPNEIRQHGRLNVGTQTFSFADATYIADPKVAYWSNPGFTWTDNQSVSLLLTIPTHVNPEPPDAVDAETITVAHNGNSLAVSWDAPARATKYDVTYYGNGVNARGAWNHTDTSLTITCDSRPDYQNQNCVSGSHAYTVGIRARNTNGASYWRNSQPAQLPAPSAPSNLRATAANGAVTLTWDDQIIVTGWEYSKDNGETWASTGSADATYTVTNLNNGTAYTFKVRGVNTSGTGPVSESVSATPRLQKPSNVTGHAPTAGDQSITFTWDQYVPTPTRPFGHYKVYIEHYAGGHTQTFVRVNDSNTTSYTFTHFGANDGNSPQLLNGRQYAVFVYVCNSAGCSGNDGWHLVTPATPSEGG